MDPRTDNHFLLSLKLSHFIAYSAAVLFLAFCVFSEQLLPDYFSWDAQAITSFAGGGLSMDRTSAVIATLIQIFSLGGLTLMIRATGVAIIFYLLYKRRHVFGIAAAACSLIAMAPLALVRPQKEVLVLVLTIAVTAILRFAKKPSSAVAMILVAYLAYTLTSGRPYYWLITGLIVALTLFDRIKLPAKITVVIAALVVGAFLPSSIYKALADTRDAVNILRITNLGLEGNRTVFVNITDNYSEIGFLINYAYAFFRLNIPVIFSQSPSEIFALTFAFFWIFLLKFAYGLRDLRARLAARIITAHLLVMWIFEPDLGSYLRHLSSITLYLAPILTAFDRTALDRLWQSLKTPRDFSRPGMQGAEVRGLARQPHVSH